MVSRGRFLFRGLYHIVHPPQYKGVCPGHRKDLLREAMEMMEEDQVLSSPGQARLTCTDRGKKFR